MTRIKFISLMASFLGVSATAQTIVKTPEPKQKQSRFRRAWLEQDKFEQDSYNEGARFGYSRSDMERIRWENVQKQALHIDADEVVLVTVMKTSDTGDITVSLTDVDGRTCTIWTAGSEFGRRIPVRAVSPY